MLALGQKNYYRRLHDQERPLMHVASTYFNTKLKEGAERLKASDFELYGQIVAQLSEATDTTQQLKLDLDCMLAFFALNAHGQLPVFAFHAMPQDLISQYAKQVEDGDIENTQAHAWRGFGVVLVDPELQGDRITARLAFIDTEINDTTQLFDVYTDTAMATVKVPAELIPDDDPMVYSNVVLSLV